MQVNESRYYYPPLQNDYLNGVLLLYKEHSKKLKSLKEAKDVVGEIVENNPSIFEETTITALQLSEELIGKQIYTLECKVNEEKEILMRSGHGRKLLFGAQQHQC